MTCQCVHSPHTAITTPVYTSSGLLWHTYSWPEARQKFLFFLTVGNLLFFHDFHYRYVCFRSLVTTESYELPKNGKWHEQKMMEGIYRWIGVGIHPKSGMGGNQFATLSFILIKRHINITVIYDVTPWTLVDIYQRFERTISPDDEIPCCSEIIYQFTRCHISEDIKSA